MNDNLINQQQQQPQEISEPIQVQASCEEGMLRLIKAMEAALKEASAENVPPLPSASSFLANNSQRTTMFNSNNSNQQLQQQQHHQVDTAIVKRAKWESLVKSRLAPLAMEVQNACGDLHERIGMMSEFGLNAGACEQEKDKMLVETARIEERIVEIFGLAAKKEEELMGELKKMAKVD